MTLPKWCTPERRLRLLELLERSGGLSVFGEEGCQKPEHMFRVFIEGTIRLLEGGG